MDPLCTRYEPPMDPVLCFLPPIPLPFSLQVAPALPSGLVLNYTNGAISGSPLTAAPATAYSTLLWTLNGAPVDPTWPPCGP